MVVLQLSLISFPTTHPYSVVDEFVSKLVTQPHHHSLRNPKRWRFPRKDHVVCARQHEFYKTSSLSEDRGRSSSLTKVVPRIFVQELAQPGAQRTGPLPDTNGDFRATGLRRILGLFEFRR